MIEVTKTGCALFHINHFSDHRGFFSEFYKMSDHNIPVVQTNYSISKPNVIRGMHYNRLNPQAKIVRVFIGHVVDVVIDLRVGSETYGILESFDLYPNNYAILVPEGFAHGFWAREESYVFYHCSKEYDPINDVGISPFDPRFRFPWTDMKGIDFLVSEKDRNWPRFKC